MSVKARIYQPAKNAMQSGRGKTKFWLLEYAPTPKDIDPLMGWSAADTLNQVRMRFDTKEEAIAFAEQNNLAYELAEPQKRRLVRKNYADNFRFDNVETYEFKQ